MRNKIKIAPVATHKTVVVAPPPISYIDGKVLQNSLKNSNYDDNFTLGLKRLFGDKIAMRAADKYNMSRSKHWKNATVFWQVDINGRVRQAKIIPYQADTLKRIRKEEVAYKFNHTTNTYIEDKGTDKVWFAGKTLLNNPNAHLEQCFFGEHLLKDTPLTTPVAMVESEKTAIVSSILMPNFVWIATGGTNGCKWLEPIVNHVLKNRAVTLFPDNDAFDKWTHKSPTLKKTAKCNFVKVSDYIKKQFSNNPKFDLADALLQDIDPDTGHLLTDQNGYPMFWDMN